MRSASAAMSRGLPGRRKARAVSGQPLATVGDTGVPQIDAVWNELGPKLIPAYGLLDADAPLFLSYCAAVFQLRMAMSELGDNPDARIAVNGSGGPVISPWVKLQQHAIESLIKTCRALGISPNLRVARPMNSNAGEENMDSFLQKGLRLTSDVEKEATPPV